MHAWDETDAAAGRVTAGRGSSRRLPASRPELVVKVGGSLARDPGSLRGLLATLVASPRQLVLLPGGGVLADAVRAVHGNGDLSEVTAHRMALLSLDQMALWMAELAGEPGLAKVARSQEELLTSLDGGVLPVVAPASWLEREAPLPTSWRVTSDSIAAWLAGRLEARRLLLLKSFSFVAGELRPEDVTEEVDAHFLDALPAGVECRFVDGRDPARVAAAIEGAEVGTRLLLDP